MKRFGLLLICVIFVLIGCSKREEKVMKKRGVSEVTTIKAFKSNILSNERDLAIYLPPDYKENTDKSYPVLYMHDGQNLFTELSGGSDVKWNVRETADKLISEGKIEDIIIVGINNNSDRIDEYTQSYMEKYSKGGRGKDYARFIVEELKPYIDSNFRTLKDRDHTAIAGSSLGGLISFYIGWSYPETFKKVGAISPSFWWNSNEMQKVVETDGGTKKDLNIWIDAGNAEESSDRNNNGLIDMVDDARDMVAALNKKGFTSHKDVMYYEVSMGSHNEDSWAKRFDQVLLYMFGKDKNIKAKSIEAEGWDTVYADVKVPMYFNPVITYSNGLKQTSLEATFKNKNQDILKVDEKGFITPLKEGETEIIVSSEKLTAKKTIKVEK